MNYYIRTRDTDTFMEPINYAALTLVGPEDGHSE